MVGETGNKNPFFSHEGSESMTVTYNGREGYAGGQVRPEDFTVILNFKDGSSVEITEYESIIQTDTFRLIKGNNTIAFYYEGLWANTTVYAKDVSTLRYPPSYVINAVDEEKVNQKINLLESGAISYEQALEKVAFTGDSQIMTLTANGILAEGQVLAKVGESLNYMEENISKIIAMSYGKEALVVLIGHANVGVIVPGYEAPVADGPQAGAGIDEVVDAVLAAERVDDAKDLALRLLQALEGTFGIRPDVAHLVYQSFSVVALSPSAEDPVAWSSSSSLLQSCTKNATSERTAMR